MYNRFYSMHFLIINEQRDNGGSCAFIIERSYGCLKLLQKMVELGIGRGSAPATCLGGVRYRMLSGDECVLIYPILLYICPVASQLNTVSICIYVLHIENV